MNTLKETKTFKELGERGMNVFFVSPHLDDAVFSAGGVMSDLKKKGVKVTLVNVFTKPSPKPYTLSVRKFLKACGYADANQLYKARIQEDAEVANKLGIRVINLGFTDALWRRKTNYKFSGFLSRIIPELNYVYPIFRFAISKGRVSKHDTALVKSLESRLRKYEGNNTYVFCPIATGRHVDHVITRNVCTNIFKRKIYWEDYPYSDFSTASKTYLAKHKLRMYNHKINFLEKNTLVNMYKTQIFAIFGKKSIKVPGIEKFYL